MVMKMAYALGIGVAAAAALGYADHTHRSPVSASETVANPNAVATSGATADEGSALAGRVLETIDVEKYTYLRLATNQGETWAAVPKAEVPRGASVTVEHAVRMDHFASATLKRTFEVIYFGSLGGTDIAGKGLPAGHPAIGSNGELPINGHIEMGQDPGVPDVLLGGPSGALPPGHPSIDPAAAEIPGTGALPPGHPGSTSSSEAIAVPKLARAPGPNGFVIADLFLKKERLAGKRVRVRGMVTKVTPDVLGLTFLHVRDGSGDDAAKTNDLAVTTSGRPVRGDVVIFEGVLRLDADLGIGYRYPALLEKATMAKE